MLVNIFKRFAPGKDTERPYLDSSYVSRGGIVYSRWIRTLRQLSIVTFTTLIVLHPLKPLTIGIGCQFLHIQRLSFVPCHFVVSVES
jgi:hypothetical protein